MKGSAIMTHPPWRAGRGQVIWWFNQTLDFLFPSSSSPSWGLSFPHKDTALSPGGPGSAPGRLSWLYFKSSSSLWKERVGEVCSKSFKPDVECSYDRLLLCVEPIGMGCSRLAFSLEVELKLSFGLWVSSQGGLMGLPQSVIGGEFPRL